MTLKTLRIATRKSPLALWQAEHVKSLLLKEWPNLHIELLPMATSGDKFLKDKLLAAGGKGLFVKELEEALINKSADIAVHSTKDMPAILPKGLVLGAICIRDNPLDAFISNQYKNIDSLPLGANIGTASLRRQSQLLAYRPDLRITTLRGNINTRLHKLEVGEYDAIILAASGLERMNLGHLITQLLPDALMLPTCGQGALCIECREEDHSIKDLIITLNDPISAICVQTERLVNAKLGGNCHVPLAVFCTPILNNELLLKTKILSVDGTSCIQDIRQGPLDQANILAEECTKSLLAQGSAALIQASTQ